MNKQILKETKRAYCDSTMEWAKATKLRNLNFRASAPVPVNDAVEIMTEALGLKSETQEGYNNFAPALLRKLPEGSLVTLAREGSVCVYVTLPKGETFGRAAAGKMMADEFHATSDGFRLWYD